MSAVAVVFVVLLGASPPEKTTAAIDQRAPTFCRGSYANEFTALSSRVAEISSRPENQFTYCLRVTATYECVSYGQDGTLKRIRKNVSAHGTAFAYRRDRGDTLLATNQHVTEFPPVTDEEHPVDGVPIGCKRISDGMRLVENERDDYEADDIPLTRVVSDVGLDMAVVRAKGTAVQVMPWKFGKSSSLRERNVVDVRGFPLGAFKATNLGTVISTYDHDDYKEWDHDDFVIDARLSQGNSGSPVLAVSCATGEYELVGIYHAGYSRGSSLNVVIQIDQVRDLLTSLKKTTVPKPDAPVSALGPDERHRLVEATANQGIFFPFGNYAASVRHREGRLVFDIYPKNFPTESWPALVLEDLPTGEQHEFGTLGRVWFGNARGLKEAERSEMNADVHMQLQRGLEVLRRAALSSVEYRKAEMNEEMSKDAFERTRRLERAMRRASTSNRDVVSAVIDMMDREGPKPGEKLDLPAPAAVPPIDAGP
jgi:serine protease Do